MKKKLFFYFRKIYLFFKEYWIDLLFYFYITFSLYVIVIFFSKHLSKELIAVIWICFFIPVFLLKLKKDKERTQNYFEKHIKESKILKENQKEHQQSVITKNV